MKWIPFVSATGEEGRQWASRFQESDYAETCRAISRSLDLLRERRFPPALKLLGTARKRRLEFRSESISRFHVLGRYTYGAEAYLHYLRSEFDQAEEALSHGLAGVKEAISQKPYLIPLADCALDFSIQRIRISRNRARRHQMKERIRTADEMVKGRRPFLVLNDGREIYLQTLRAFYNDLQLTACQIDSLGPLYGAESGANEFGLLIARLCRSDMVPECDLGPE